MGEKGQNVISYFIQHLISLIFAIHVSFITPLPLMWILLTKPMQKSVTTVCLHCSFARLKNKHIGVLGTNVATISWLHWSPVSEYKPSTVPILRVFFFFVLFFLTRMRARQYKVQQYNDARFSSITCCTSINLKCQVKLDGMHGLFNLYFSSKASTPLH